ncbi:MAG: hypothetical protein VX451_04405 [Candidatus Thermoplasmatota archaeon]|nr:hypothetical protein [Candidatus Thermoplasmatota archaeon]
MMTNCDECGGNLTLDLTRAEGVCDVCSLVHPILHDDADTNSASSLGESRHNEAVNAEGGHGGAKLGAKMNPFGDKFDGRGNRLTAKQKRLAARIGKLDRSSQRDTDPMHAQLMATLRNMFGADVARAVGPLARAATRKLTRAQEATRKTLTPGERRRLKCPKTSICRAGGKEHPELRGKTDQDNLQIMALAIASIAARWFRTVSVNEKQLMDMYGITAKQLKNAKKVIMQHYQERVNQGWAAPPQQLSAAAAREDELDKVVDNLSDGLSKRLDDDDLDDIMNAFLGIMSSIGEPSVDAPTANIPISMVAGCVMYNLLCRLGLQSGNLSAVAKAVRRSGAGIKSRLEELQARYERGEFPQGAELFADEVDEAADGDRSADEEPADE